MQEDNFKVGPVWARVEEIERRPQITVDMIPKLSYEQAEAALIDAKYCRAAYRGVMQVYKNSPVGRVAEGKVAALDLVVTALSDYYNSTKPRQD